MHLHIGKNNVLIHVFQRSGFCEVVSNAELLSMSKRDLKKFTKVSISAFNPDLKLRFQNMEDPITAHLRKNIHLQNHIIYFSTARIFDENISEHYALYIKNKEFISSLIKETFPHFSCVYLPNIIPILNKDKSNFIDQFLKNLSRKNVSFDCNTDSYWNYVNPDRVVDFINNLSEPIVEALLMNQTHLTVNELILLSKALHEDVQVKISLGTQWKRYPSLVPEWIEIVQLESQGINWITNRNKLLRY